MKITLDNYELFVIDMLDGSLSDSDKNLLAIFLEKHPEIKSEIQGIDLGILKGENISYPNKESLKHSVFTDEETFNDTAVAYLENTLKPQEKKAFNIFLESNTTYQHHFENFRLTKLVPDLSIIFPNKDLLYRSSKIVPLFLNITRIASIAALIIWALLIIKPTRVLDPSFVPVASTDVEKIPTEIKQTTDNNSDTNKTNTQQQVIKVSESLKDTPEQMAIVSINKPSDKKESGEADDIIINSQTQRDVLKPLKPKRPKLNHYVLILKPTITELDKNNLLANRNTPIKRITKTGENILSKGSNINFDRTQVEKGLLNALKLASNNKISYETNTLGQINKIRLKSELLAFSFPLRGNNKNKQ